MAYLFRQLNRYIFRLGPGQVLLAVALLLQIVLLEMRPGRLYFILNVLLFQWSLVQFVAFLFILVLCGWSILILLLNRSKLIRIVFAVLIFPCLLISISYKLITGYNYMYSDAMQAVNNLAFTDNAVVNFHTQIAFALLIIFILYLTGYFTLKKIKKVYPASFAFIPLLAGLLAWWQVKTSVGMVDDFPAFFRVPVTTLAAAADNIKQVERQPVSEQPTGPQVKHLFLIVDESITGSSLSLNNNPVNTTPFLKAVSDSSLINFGIASSYTNYSSGSNIALMTGPRMAELPDKNKAILARPNIFQFAKKAGYTTYFIDGQATGGAMQNFMTLEDRKYIDHFVLPADLDPDLSYHERDFAMADLLIQLAKSEEKVFVYAIKVGAHWPYARTYPTDSAIFTPVLSPRSFYKDKERSLNTYYNSIRWSVDSFWKKLLLQTTPADSTVMIYTSDHGQDLQGSGISIMHASVYETNPQEADVPLFLADKTGYLPKAFKPGSAGQYSHENIFQTLLLLQGYDTAYVKKHYGHSLLDDVPVTQRQFIVGDIFGRGPHQKLPFYR